MLIWTAAVGGWFVVSVLRDGNDGTALVLAVGAGLIGVIWLLGLLVLGLFLLRGE